MKLHKRVSSRNLHLERLESRHMLTGVVINEIHFDPDKATEPVEFIELHNSNPVAVDLSNWVLDDAVDFAFAPGTMIDANEYLVITQSTAAFQAKFGLTADGEWEIGDRLSNEGERIALRDAIGQVVDEVDYQLGFPWPTVGEHGSSIELIHPALDNDLGGNWRSSNGDSDLPTTPQTLVAAQAANWRYRKGTSEASTPVDAWRLPGFVEDGSWQTAQTSIGYGDSDDNTILTDMRNNYTSIYLRNTFTISDTIPNTLLLRVYVDDGAMVWINGTQVGTFHVPDSELAHDDLAWNHNTSGFEELVLSGTAQYLSTGENTIAIHVLNSSINSSDLSIDAEVIIPAAGSVAGIPTPGERNSVFNANAAPQLRHRIQSVEQPASGEDVVISIKATDPDGVQGVTLDYQLVDPGDYIRQTDAAYEENWVTIAMHDDGLHGDAAAGDDVYSVTLPGSLQTHRRLVRYRITATDTLDASVTGPYADDPQSNFAYFVYDGVPSWSGANNPGVDSPIVFGTVVMSQLPIYHLIANASDVTNSQYNGSFDGVRFKGTLVYNGKVYDHIEFHNRGEASTYVSGKNKWRIRLNRGHEIQTHDNNGNPRQVTRRIINLNAAASPWIPQNRGMAGNEEALAFRLYDVAGMASPDTSFLHFRVIDAAAESTPNDQYASDLWGLYMMVEHPDGRFLDERNLPDGNVYKIEGNRGDKKNQGPTQPIDDSDYESFKTGFNGTQTLQWWRDNVDLESYYTFRAVNQVVPNVDLRNGWNHYQYHNPVTNQWTVIPWDLDIAFVPQTHWSGVINIQNALSQHTELRMEYEARARELLDLLFTPDQIDLLVEEFSSVVNPAGQARTFADVDQYMWNYHPRTRSNHRGAFYRNPDTITVLFGGNVTRTLVSADHEGMAQWLRDFLLPASESGGSDPTGYGYNQLVQHASDGSIPNRPTLTYVGQNGFPRDELTFQSSPFSDPQGVGTFAAMEWRVAEIHNPSVSNFDPTRRNVYEVEGTWESGELSAFVNQITIPESAIKSNRTYRARVRMQDSSGRWSHWSDAVEFLVTPAASTVAGDLVISEINYNPYDPTTDELIAIPGIDNDEFEFIEVVNVNPTQTISLLGYELSNAVSFSFGNTDLAPGERAVVVENAAAFALRYGNTPNVLGQWTGGLNNSGEKIVLSDPAGQITLDFSYSDSNPWATTPDGHGATLELINPVETTADAFGEALSWRGSTEYGGTPGDTGFGPIGVIINELLAHTDPPKVDSIEIYNTSSETIDIGGWFLSDSENDFFKFQIPDGTSLAAGSHRVFDEHDFNPGGGTISTDFALSAGGDDVWLIEADSERQPSRFVDVVHFDATRSGVPLGRVPSGDATYDLFPLARDTLGNVNTPHEPGDLIISEVHYHPTPPPGSYSITEAQLEFVEIHNRGAGAISLSQIALDGGILGAWELRGGVDFDFDTLSTPTTIPSGGTRVLVSFDPINETLATEFRTIHGVDATVVLIGPYSGQLNNNGETIRLLAPTDPLPETTEAVHYLVDRVTYNDTAPWPTEPDGAGDSLSRKAERNFGDYATSWQAGTPTPGSIAFIPTSEADFDSDGDVDRDDLVSWQLGFGMLNDSSREDGDADADGDVDGNDFLAWQRNHTSPLGQASSDSLEVTATVVSDQSLQTWSNSSKTRQIGPRRETAKDAAIQEIFRGNDEPSRVESVAALVAASRPTRRMGPYRKDTSSEHARERLHDLGLTDYLASSVLQI